MAGFWGVSRAIEPLDSNGLIKTNSISLSKKISRDRQDLENKLNTKYQDALKNFQEKILPM